MEHYSSLRSILIEGPFQRHIITVETAIRRGIPSFTISGIAAGHGREIAERIRSALHSCGYPLPYSAISVNLAPVDLRKKGAGLDLPIALSVLLAADPEKRRSFESRFDLSHTLFLGELSLSGELREFSDPIGCIEAAREGDIHSIYLPCSENFAYPDFTLKIFRIASLLELIEERRTISEIKPVSLATAENRKSQIDELKLPLHVRRAIMISAAGRHSILFLGPAGSGKTSSAREIVSLLPQPQQTELIEIFNVRHKFDKNASYADPVERPVRMPHHTSTPVALVGGGLPVSPGEATRAHRGVLILDELAEFSRASLQALREPLETGSVHIARGREWVVLPANFLLVATSNPCPCGNHGSRYKSCLCSLDSVRNYQKRIEGPLRDRIELQLYLDYEDETADGCGMTTIKMERMIALARKRQTERFEETKYVYNSEIKKGDLERFCPLPERNDTETLLIHSRLSHRALDSVRRVARTIADLDGSDGILDEHYLEALSFRITDIDSCQREPSFNQEMR